MKYGIHQLLFAESLTPKDLPVMDLTKDLGFDGMELTLFDPETFPIAEIKERSRQLGLRLNTCVGLSSKHNLISPDPQIRRAGIEFMKLLVDITQQIGAENLTGVNYAGWGYLTGKMRTEQEWDWGVAAYREICQFARENTDVVLCTEVVNRFETHFLNIASDAVRFIQEVGGQNVRVQLDTFHMIREEDSFSDAIKTCGAHLGYVHACESQRGIPGTGLVPWESFFRALRSVGYDGWITIESFDPNLENIAKLCCMWRKFADSPKQLASQGLSFLREMERTTMS